MLRFTCQCYLNRNLRFISNARSAITSLSSKCDGDENTTNEKVVKKLEVLPIIESITESTTSDKQVELSESKNISDEKDTSVVRKKKNWKRKRKKKKVEASKGEVESAESKEVNKLVSSDQAAKEKKSKPAESEVKSKLLSTDASVKKKEVVAAKSVVKPEEESTGKNKLVSNNKVVKKKKSKLAESQVKPERLMEQIKSLSTNPTVEKSLNSIVNDIDLEQPGSVEKLGKLLDMLNTNPKLVEFFTKQKKSGKNVSQLLNESELKVEGKFKHLQSDIKENRDDNRKVTNLMSALINSQETSSSGTLQNLMGMVNLQYRQARRRKQGVSSDFTASDIKKHSSEKETVKTVKRSTVKNKNKKMEQKQESEINDASKVLATSIVEDDINMKQLKGNRKLRNKGVKLKEASSLSDISFTEDDNSQSTIQNEKKRKKKLKKSKSSPDLTESVRDKNVKSKQLKTDKQNIPKAIPSMFSSGEKFEIMKLQSEQNKKFNIDLMKGPSTTLFSGISHKKSVTHTLSLNEIDWLEDWDETLRRVSPHNRFHHMMSTIDRQWEYPIDNEQDIGFEESYTEHVFLEHYLDEFPNIEPIQKFMELVIIGLQQNPYLTAAQKIDKIMWHKEYFENIPDAEIAVSY